MHENQFTNEVLAKLGNVFESKDLEKIRKALSLEAEGYTIDKRSAELVPFQGVIILSFYESYLICLRVEGKSAGTIKQYDFALRDFFRTVCKPIEQVSANDIRAYLVKKQLTRGVGNRSLDHRRLIINTFMNWAATEGYISGNPCSAVKPIRYETKERKPLTGEELYILRDSLTDPRDKAMFAVLYSTGCRVSELVRLKKADIDFESGEVHLFGKGSKHRTSFLNSEAKVALKRYLESREDDEDAVFVSIRKPYKTITKVGVESRIRVLAERAGIDRHVFPHLIRHTTATDALRRGMPVTDLQTMLGHSKIETTMIYAKVSDRSVQHSHERCFA